MATYGLAMVSHLTLVSGGSAANGLRYWDIAVDGQLLRDLFFEASGPGGGAGDYAPVLVHNWPIGMSDDVLVLLGDRPPELPTGRVPVFVCSECGDLGCGAVTLAVERTADTVAWRDFGWETNYTTDEDEEKYEAFPGGPFVFARDQYESELRRFADTFDEVRAAGPSLEEAALDARRRRRRRWWTVQ